MRLKNILQKVRDFSPRAALVSTKRILRETPLEVVLAGMLGLVSGFGFSYSHESERAREIPLGFCEIREIEKRAERENRKVEPMTHFLTTTNDLTMKIFECWNEANSLGSNNVTKRFTEELYDSIDSAAKYHRYNVQNLVDFIPERTSNALQRISQLDDVKNKLSKGVSQLDDAWTESHIDSYRTETYLATESYTVNGKTQTRTVTKTRRVYDHTTHHYSYHSESGNAAASTLEALTTNYPNLKNSEILSAASRTNAEGEGAAIRSRDKVGEKVNLSETQLLEIANTWAKGSTYSTNVPFIYSNWGNVKNSQMAWSQAKNSAHSRTYITYSHFDSGPKEYRVATETENICSKVANSIGEITDGINYARENAPKIPLMIKELNEIVFHHKKGDADSLARKILDTSTTMYEKNFKNGFEVDRIRPSRYY